MFVRKVPVRHGATSYSYLRVVENVRQGGKVRQQTVLNLGNVSHWEEGRLAAAVRALSAFVGAGEPAPPAGVPLAGVSYGEVRVLGPYLPLAHLWEELGLDAMLRAAVGGRQESAPLLGCARAMVLSQAVAPRSKQASWQRVREQVEIPGVDGAALPLHAYYRTLTALAGCKGSLEQALHQRLAHLFNRELSLVFYDVTPVYFEGTKCPRARRGYSREHRPDLLQVEVGLLVDGDGLPIGHELFDGNVKDMTTVLTVLAGLRERFQVQRCVFVGDDGLASEANLQALCAAGYEYITSLSMGHSQIGTRLLGQAPARREWPPLEGTALLMARLGEEGGVRYLGTYHPARAAANRVRRQRRLLQCVEALRALQAPPKLRARRRTPAATLAVAERFLRDKYVRGLFTLALDAEGRLQWALQREALQRERRLDGVLVLKTNSTTLTDAEVVGGYRTLWRVEDAFRHLKDEIHLRPIRHWTDPRVAGHVLVCVLAYLLERLYEQALARAGLPVSARDALERLAPVTVATLEAGDQRLRRRARLTPEQQQLLAAVGLHQLPEIW
jgi:hypothetical protein